MDPSPEDPRTAWFPQGVTSTAISLNHRAIESLRSHLGNARAVSRRVLDPTAAYEPVSLAYVGGELSTNGSPAGSVPVLSTR